MDCLVDKMDPRFLGNGWKYRSDDRFDLDAAWAEPVGKDIDFYFAVLFAERDIQIAGLRFDLAMPFKVKLKLVMIMAMISRIFP